MAAFRIWKENGFYVALFVAAAGGRRARPLGADAAFYLAQRHEGAGGGRQSRAGGFGAAVVSGRQRGRAPGQNGFEPRARTYDVQGHESRAGRAVQPPHRRAGRQRQRLHQPHGYGVHHRHRVAAFGRGAAHGGRPHERPQFQRPRFRQRDGRDPRGAADAHRRQPVGQNVGNAQYENVAQTVQPSPGHRLYGRPAHAQSRRFARLV